MSQENVNLVMRLVTAWNLRDLEAMTALADTEIEYVNSPTAVEPGTRRGVEELQRVVQAQWEILEGGRQESEHVYDRGDEVLWLGEMSRLMPGSDARIGDRQLVAYGFRNGRVARVEILGFGEAEVQHALEAAGLAE